jgi:hypothetical protein
LQGERSRQPRDAAANNDRPRHGDILQ